MASGTGLLKEKDLTPVVDIAGAYADGDVLFPTIELADVFSHAGAKDTQARGVALNSITMVDKDDEAALEVELWFFKSDVSIGVANAAFAGITDLEAEELLAVVTLDSATDTFIDLINGRFYEKEGLAVQMQQALGSVSLFVGAINRTNTPTFTAAGDLFFRFGFTAD